MRATEILDRDGFMMRPPWEELQGGKRPPSSENAEPRASGSMAGNIMRLPLEFPLSGDRWSLPQSCAADQAHLRSHSGLLHQRRVARSSDRPGVQGHLGTCPARWPLQIVDVQCGALLDEGGLLTLSPTRPKNTDYVVCPAPNVLFVCCVHFCVSRLACCSL